MACDVHDCEDKFAPWIQYQCFLSSYQFGTGVHPAIDSFNNVSMETHAHSIHQNGIKSTYCGKLVFTMATTTNMLIAM